MVGIGARSGVLSQHKSNLKADIIVLRHLSDVILFRVSALKTRRDGVPQLSPGLQRLSGGVAVPNA